ncbi:Bax inhibitor-1/YccA family protein [Pleionea mediterranea]|jgi:modulator of FtsH protease|uniref:Modulator of FtsH protease n=1 Tax=Pleionea mediterranea TaxID=523701 RepID=A0A316FXD6_9GAMM|nr:Bax inhibitor-1/YccA family protein [Pleionea mediterranea]PWK53258.1 modulator of FtsH protease [Pleionea mediterranea]
MEHNVNTLDRSASSAIEVNKVLKNTYMLLGLTLAFSAFVAYLAAVMQLPHPGIIITLVGFYGLLFAIHKTQNSGAGIALVFLLTGFMGYTLGPIIGFVSANAPQVLMTALGGTGLTFFGLSAYVLITRKDMSFLAGTLMAGFWVLIVGMIANLIFNIPALSLAISGAFILFSSMIIMYQTSAIIHGGERNYVMATVTLFVSIYNIFVSLLSILMSFSGDD